MLSDTNTIDVLHRISDLIRLGRASDRLTQEIVDTIESTIGYEYGAVLLHDPATRRLEPLALSKQGKGDEFLDGDRAFVFSQTPVKGTGITGFVAASTETTRPNAYTANDQRFLEIVSLLIATAIERGRLEKAGLLRQAAELEVEFSEVLPVCSYCKRVRIAEDEWQRFEAFVAERLRLSVSHGACPGCLGRVRSASTGARATGDDESRQVESTPSDDVD